MDEYVRDRLEREVVDVRETEWVHDDRAEFEATERRVEHLDGSVIVAVTNDAGEVLLIENDWMDGYGFPGGGVEPGEHPEAAARREVAEETGVEVEIHRPVSVGTGTHVYRGDDGEERVEANYGVLFLATPVGAEVVADDPGVDDETIERVGWFAEVPERAFQPDEIRRVLEGDL